MKTILFPVDFCSHATHTTHFGVELAHQLGAQVLLLYVVQPAPPLSMTGEPSVDLLAWNHSVYDCRQDDMRELEDKLHDYQQREGLADVVVRIRLEVDRPADSTLEIATTEQVAFIVMGTVGASNAWEKLIGSVTSTVAQRAGQPLWILPNAVRLSMLR